MAERIKWRYWHHNNGRKQPPRRVVKEGEYFGQIKHTYRHWNKGRPQMALVHFDGNKYSSRVPYSELEFIEQSNEQ